MTELSAGELVSRVYTPEVYLKNKKLSSFYEEHPRLSRFVMIPLGTASGFAKVFLFPLISIIGMIVLPIFALYKLVKGEKGSLEALKGAAICLLGICASIGFLAVTGYHIPLVWCSGIFITLLVGSITFHVYKMAKEPPKMKQSLSNINI